MKRVLSYLMMAAFVVLATFFTACSSPEKEGIKAAQKVCDGTNNSLVIVRKAYESYIKDFNSYSFKTRIAAREKFDETTQKAQEEIRELENKASEYVEELKSKYKTNEEDVNKFDYAYNAQRNDCKPKEEFNVYEYHERINSLILTIIPPKPDFEKVKKDLVGKSIPVHLPWHDYYRADHKYGWDIYEHELIDIKLQSTIDIDEDEYQFFLNFHLYRKEINRPSIEVNAKVTYKLGTSDDWRIVRLESLY